MKNHTSKTSLAAWVTVVTVLALCSGLYFQQHIRAANAATTNYQSAPSATYTPDTLLW
jgi:hypothetical protein